MGKKNQKENKQQQNAFFNTFWENITESAVSKK